MKWKYLSIALIVVIASGVLAPRAFAANPTMKDVMYKLIGIDTNVNTIKVKTDNLPNDPSSQSLLGTTKAIRGEVDLDPPDGVCCLEQTILTQAGTGKSFSGDLTLRDTRVGNNLISVACAIIKPDHSAYEVIILGQTNGAGAINVSFASDSLTIKVQDISDGVDDVPTAITHHIQYVETTNVTDVT